MRGTVNSTEAGYQPQGGQPRDFTDFEQVIQGYDPVIVEWEDSVRLPFDGTMSQRHEQAPKVKVTDMDGSRYEREEINPHGSVFQYEDGTEFKLPRKEGENEEEYQTRFKEALGDELERLAKPENKKKDKWGREYHEQMHTKYFIKKYQVGRYYAAYFLNDEAKTVFKE